MRWKKYLLQPYLLTLLLLSGRDLFAYQRLFEYQIDHFQQGVLKRQAQLQSTLSPDAMFRYFYLRDPQVQVRLTGSRLCLMREQTQQLNYCLSDKLKGNNRP